MLRVHREISIKINILNFVPIQIGLISLCIVASIAGADAQSAINSKVPLATAFDMYSAAANRGDVSAASELFEKSRECLVVRNIDSRMTSLQSDKSSLLNAPEKYGPLLASHLEKVAGARRRAEASRAMCQGSENKLTTESIYGIALTAARLGDVSASACFMASPWPVDKSDVDKAKASEYKAAALYLAIHMIEKGDWHFVEAMAIASSPGMRSGYAVYIQNDDAAAQLRYSQLLRLGVTPDSDAAKNLDLSISILSDRLQPEEVARSDHWAHEMFRRYYASQAWPADISPCNT